jgi:hypothetical protein
MKKSELRQVIKEEINELFGLSKKEKDQKALKNKIEQAKKEIDKFNFNSLFKEPAIKSSGQDIQKLVGIALNNAKNELKTVNELIPSLFIEKDGSKVGAATAFFIFPSSKEGKLKGVIPSTFWFLLDNYTLVQNEEAKKRMNKKIEELI